VNPTQPKKAWQIDRELRLGAIPVDRRTNPSRWEEMASFPHGDDLIALFWNARVPGSGAPEIPYVEMVQSMHNRGYDVREAESLLEEGIHLAKKGRRDDLRVLTAGLLASLHDSPKIPGHPYWSFEHPEGWEAVRTTMAAKEPDPAAKSGSGITERIYQGWLGQLAGGAFGTCIEGYHTDQILKVYGEIDGYITQPETMNDDVVYELVLLDVFENKGRQFTSKDLGLEWVRQIPFGWSAEWVALENLRAGMMPPVSASFRNPYSDWIGAQMRGMVCGMLAPGQPLEAARLGYLDASVSHCANGIYGEIFSAVLVSMAFDQTDTHKLISQALRYIPQQSEYHALAEECLAIMSGNDDFRSAWTVFDKRLEEYNWIHAYPNLAADLLALWYGGGDITESFKILAYAGMDVDCNAGLIGNILGMIKPVPEKWSAPLDDLLETYLPGKERLSIRELSERTARLAISG
jgi:ADP-ribosylglycohydrolase